MSVLLVIVAFGIFGTIVMMFGERVMEFCILLSIGMQKTKILLTTVIEVFILTTLGILASWAIISPLLIYVNRNPIPMGGGAEEAIKQYGFEGFLIGENFMRSASPELACKNFIHSLNIENNVIA